MRFLWKTQLKRERGKLSLKQAPSKGNVSRKERLASAYGKPHMKAILFGVVFLWSLFVVTLGYIFFFSPFLFITAPEVVGTRSISQEAVAQMVTEEISGKYFSLIPRNSFFLIRPEEIEHFLQERYPLMRAVSVTRVFPNHLQVVVTEREKIVVWCSFAHCFHITEDGSVFPVSAAFEEPENLGRTITIRDMSEEPMPVTPRVFQNTFVPLVIAVEEAFRRVLHVEVDETFTVVSYFADDLRVKTNDGFEVYISTKRPLEDSMAALSLLFEKELSSVDTKRLRYIDVRTENHIYYAFLDEVKQTSETPVASKDTKEVGKKK